MIEEFVRACVKEGKKVDEAAYGLDAAAPAAPAAAEEAPAAEEEAAPAPAKKKRGRAAAAAAAEAAEESAPKKAAAAAASDDDEPEVKEKVVVKGRAAVDKFVPGGAGMHVVEDGGIIWDAMLNQTNIAGNNNKFYVIQVLQSDKGAQFYAWNRWGRVGEPGQHKLVPCGASLDAAKRDFMKKFRDKTKNDWMTVARDRTKFRTMSGLYTLIHIDYGTETAEDEAALREREEKAKARVAEKEKKGSKLDPRVQDLIRLIFDMKMMERAMVEFEFDVKKQPLGKLTKEQIRNGYLVLKEIEAAINSGQRGKLIELSNRFYTLIPHSFGRMRPPVIGDSETIKKKLAMLEALGDIEIAARLIKEAEESDESPIDANYKRLNADLQPVDPDTEEFKAVLRYVQNTHPRETPRIKTLFRLARPSEGARYEPKKALGNRMLLWHGSRLTNFVGILSQGLRIAPPEAPASGYRFGKGIYFADICQLASRYCRAYGQTQFLMLLGDVALGKTADLARDQYMERPLPGTDSTKALGTQEPDPRDRLVQPSGCVVPYGRIVDSPFKGVSCLEHQYIVYDVAQCELKYLVQFG